MSLADVKAAAKGHWVPILTGCGVPSEALTNRHKPCLICGGIDRFRYDDKDGNGTYYCSGCGPGDGIALLSGFLGISTGEVLKMLGDKLAVTGTPTPKIDRRAEFRELFLGCGSPAPVAEYLKGRGLDEYPSCLRYHPSVEGKPAMLAVITGPDGDAVGVHRTHLEPSGVRKRTTSLSGSLPHGSAVRLFFPGRALGVAEGIETAIAAQQMHGVPTWAVLSTSGMKRFQPPDGVEELIIFGDTDQSYAGQAAAYSLAHRLACDDRVTCKVSLQFPIEGDWLDELNFLRKARG